MTLPHEIERYRERARRQAAAELERREARRQAEREHRDDGHRVWANAERAAMVRPPVAATLDPMTAPDEMERMVTGEQRGTMEEFVAPSRAPRYEPDGLTVDDALGVVGTHETDGDDMGFEDPFGVGGGDR